MSGSVQPAQSRWTSLRATTINAANEGGAWILHRLESWVLRHSEIETTPFLSPESFPWVKVLEDNFNAIRTELDDVLRYRDDLPNFQDISTDQASITNDDRWKTYFLFGYGFKSEANCARCPETARLLEQVPGMTTAFFSILSGHKHIGEHRGPWRGVIRYHLALKIPEPADRCGISVGGEVAHWQEGKSLLFDDGYEHFAWNDTDGVRVVLFVDVLRPLRRPAEWVNKGLIKSISVSPYVRDGKARELDWERRFELLRGKS
jgi:beta-hydroxylase